MEDDGPALRTRCPPAPSWCTRRETVRAAPPSGGRKLCDRHDGSRHGRRPADATLLLALELAAGHAGSRDEVLRRIVVGLEVLGRQATDGEGPTLDMGRAQVRARRSFLPRHPLRADSW